MTPSHKRKKTSGRRETIRRAGLVLGAILAIGVSPPPAKAGIGMTTAELNELTVENYVTALIMMTEQFSAVMMQQVAAVGMFLDAKHQLETQRLFQEMTARAHKAYQPTETICTIGSSIGSLWSTQAEIRANSAALGAGLRKRELLNKNMSSSWGAFSDRHSRLLQVKATFCDQNDNNNQLDDFCDAPVSQRINSDLNYGRTIDKAWTLDLNFMDTTLTNDEADIIALMRNLFAHNTFTYIPERILVEDGTARELLLDTRTITAVRSVAENSISSIVATKATGTTLTADNLRAIALALGMPAADVNDIIGTNPSYYAQMEIITQKLFENPQFFVNLYDKPANVARIGVALRALDILATRDKFEESLRREMLLALLLEMKLRRYQEEIENRITGDIRRDGPKSTP